MLPNFRVWGGAVLGFANPRGRCQSIITARNEVAAKSRSLSEEGGSLSWGSLSRGLCPGGLCPGGLYLGGLCPGMSLQGVSVGGSPRESISRGVSVLGVSSQGMSLPRRCLCPGGSLSEGSLSGESLRQRHPQYGNMRAISILLECILVSQEEALGTPPSGYFFLESANVTDWTGRLFILSIC